MRIRNRESGEGWHVKQWVVAPCGSIGRISEIDFVQRWRIAVDWLVRETSVGKSGPKNAWWKPEDLTIANAEDDAQRIAEPRRARWVRYSSFWGDPSWADAGPKTEPPLEYDGVAKEMLAEFAATASARFSRLWAERKRV